MLFIFNYIFNLNCLFFIFFVQVQTICHWQANEDLRLAEEKRKQRVPQAESISVETTAYALLQTLLVNDITYATPVVRWLTEQRKKGGGFRSTQVYMFLLELDVFNDLKVFATFMCTVLCTRTCFMHVLFLKRCWQTHDTRCFNGHTI